MVVDRDGPSRVPWRSALMLLLLISMSLAGVGCRSGPALAFQGARHYAAGSEALERGDPRQAIEELERASRLVPHSSEIQNHLGLAYWTDAQPVRARNAFARAIELDCDNQAARTNLARVMNAPEAAPFAKTHDVTNSGTANPAAAMLEESARIQSDQRGDRDGG